MEVNLDLRRIYVRETFTGTPGMTMPFSSSKEVSVQCKDPCSSGSSSQLSLSRCHVSSLILALSHETPLRHLFSLLVLLSPILKGLVYSTIYPAATEDK